LLEAAFLEPMQRGRHLLETIVGLDVVDDRSVRFEVDAIGKDLLDVDPAAVEQ
jgi:hypothetical protein